MGRKQRRARENKAVPQIAYAKLEPAFPSSPVLPPRYGFYIYRDTKFLAYQAFYGTYAARKFLDVLLKDVDWEFAKPNENEVGHNDPGKHLIECSNGIQVKAWKHDFDVLDYEMTEEEEAWEIPEPHIHQWYALRARADAGDPEPTPMKYLTKEERREAKREAREARRSEKAERAPRTPRPSKEGLVTAVEIAKEMGVDPKEARIALRASDEKKPDCGWAWDRSEVERIKKVIKANLKVKK